VIIIALLLISVSGICSPARKHATVDLSIIFSTKAHSDFNTLVIPIKRVHNLIVIEAKIDTVIGNFILDTGSPYLILNKTYYREAWTVENLMASNAAGSVAEPIMRTSVHNLAIKELYFEKLTADLSDLGHIENQRGLKILGLLGVNLFTSFEMVIDLHKSVMYLHKLDKNGMVPEKERLVKSEPVLKVPFTLYRNIITLNVKVAGKDLVFCLDTGAETNALSNQVPGKIFDSFEVSKRTVLLGTGGSHTEVLFGTLNELAVGTKTFKNMHVIITKLENLGNGYGRSIQGILGNSFLVKGIISINFVTKELCLYPFDVVAP